MVVNVHRVVLATSLAVVFGCGDTAPESSRPGEVVRSSVRRRAPSEELGDVRALARNDADFAFELLRELPSDENLFFAPHSISTALAMTYAGAAGSTARVQPRSRVPARRRHIPRARLRLSATGSFPEQAQEDSDSGEQMGRQRGVHGKV